MTRRLMAASLVLLAVNLGTGNMPGLCQEGCSPTVTDWAPQGTIEDNFPTISATFKSECGTDIDPASIQMLVGGSPVKYEISGKGSEVTASYDTEKELKMDIRYEILVRARDVKGKEVEKSWRFYLPFHY